MMGICLLVHAFTYIIQCVVSCRKGMNFGWIAVAKINTKAAYILQVFGNIFLSCNLTYNFVAKLRRHCVLLSCDPRRLK